MIHKPFLLFFCLGIGLLLSGCAMRTLTVQTQFLTRENLASYHIGSPDPKLEIPTLGERLLIQWSLPKNISDCPAPTLQLKVRFRNHQEDEITVRIEKKWGYYLYDLTDQEYCQSGGILTYLVQIRQGECLLAEWKHPLWTPLITFSHPQTSS